MVIAETQFLDIQTFSVLEVGAVLFLAKRAKMTLLPFNCKCLTVYQVGPRSSVKRNKQVLSNFEG